MAVVSGYNMASLICLEKPRPCASDNKVFSKKRKWVRENSRTEVTMNSILKTTELYVLSCGKIRKLSIKNSVGARWGITGSVLCNTVCRRISYQ